jgi:hypothetical protein
MMSTSSLITSVEQCIPHLSCACIDLESFPVSKLSEKCGILLSNYDHGAADAETRIPLFFERMDSLLCQQEENDGILLEPSLFLNRAFSIRGGGGDSSSSSSFSIDHVHHPLAFATNNPSPHVSHHYISSPLHAAVAASAIQPSPEKHSLQDSSQVVVADDTGSARHEVAGTMTIANHVVTKRHADKRRRRFRWRFRFRRRRRQSVHLNLDDIPKANTTLTQSPKQETVVPLRFQRAAKNNVELGRQRYLKTRKWRQEYKMDTILSEPHVYFEFIKQHYPHYFHLFGRNGQPVYYEMPAKTNLQALRQGGVTLDVLLRHYAMVTEFTWQYISRDDLQQSIYIIDMCGIRPRDFVGECVTFVRKACAICNQHYPERSGCILVIHVPSYFQLIWRVVKTFADPKTLAKVKILCGKEEILDGLLEFIDFENIPPEYGGSSMPLGEAPEEKLLWDVMRHNNHVALHGTQDCGGTKGGCPFCNFELARNY